MPAVESSPTRVALKVFAAAKEENVRIRQAVMKNALKPYPNYDQLLKYQEELKPFVSTAERPVELAMDEENLLCSEVVCQGLQQMVNISVAVVALFSAYRKCFFSDKLPGITQAIQLLTSK